MASTLPYGLEWGGRNLSKKNLLKLVKILHDMQVVRSIPVHRQVVTHTFSKKKISKFDTLGSVLVPLYSGFQSSKCSVALYITVHHAIVLERRRDSISSSFNSASKSMVHSFSMSFRVD